MSPRPASDCFKCRLPRSINSLGCLGRWIDHVSAALQLPPTAEYALRLCIEEAVANVMMHGNAIRTTGQAVGITLQAGPDSLQVTIQDDCAPFDPASVPLPRLHEDMPGGHGLQLMRRFAAAVSYRRVGDLNQLAMTINRR